MKANKKEKMPFYLRESLPDPKQMPVKTLASGFPESIDRPGVEQLQKLVTGLYIQEQGKHYRRLAALGKRQSRKAKVAKR